jgi:predicted RNA-binding Zn-ribbon protein involved in translation (DUF1610 family)
MVAFLASFFAISLASAGAVILVNDLDAPWQWSEIRSWCWFVIGVWPAIGAFMSAAFLDWWRPRRLFASRAGLWKPQLLRGAFAGIVAMTIGAFAVGIEQYTVRDEYIMAASGFLGATLIVFAGRRVRPGRCWTCDYDLTESMSQTRCPECGENIHASHEAPRTSGAVTPQTPPPPPTTAPPHTPAQSPAAPPATPQPPPSAR